MERPSENLIYNRSLKDVQRVAELNKKISNGSATAEEVQGWFKTKGALNHTDLNRIETWTEFLSNYLKSYGYNAPIKKRTERTYIPQVKPEGGVVIPDAELIVYSDWRMWDIPELTEINRIRDNVNAIQKGFYSLSDWRDIACKDNPNFEDINTLEWDLQSIYQWLNLMMLNFTFSGEIYAGEAW